MVKILNVLGTRPQRIKFINITGKDVVVCTGQHWDEDLKAVELPKGAITLSSCSLTHMTEDITKLCVDYKPDLVVVYGDTRSSLAGTLAAFSSRIALVHLEAGARNGCGKRPEERIRRAIDQMADYLFCVNERNKQALEKEGVLGEIFVVGDLHYDKYLANREDDGYVYCTIHRAEHTDNRGVLCGIIEGLKKEGKVVFLAHPRTLQAIKKFRINIPKNVEMRNPVGYLDMLKLIRTARKIITDSGGLTKEAFFSGTPVDRIGNCEWEEEVSVFGNGDAGDRIRSVLLNLKKGDY